MTKSKMTFEKGYETNWTQEVFEITECVSSRYPYVYRLRDLLSDNIQGTFYFEEFQRVSLKNEYAVEKILEKQLRKKKLEYWIKYKGYPQKFNQWIPFNFSVI